MLLLSETSSQTSGEAESKGGKDKGSIFEQIGPKVSQIAENIGRIEENNGFSSKVTTKDYKKKDSEYK